MVSEDGGKRLLAWGHFVPSVVRHMDPEDANECIPIYSALFDERGIEEKNLRRQWRGRPPPRRGPRVRLYLGPRKLSPSSSAASWRWISPSLPSTGCRLSAAALMEIRGDSACSEGEAGNVYVLDEEAAGRGPEAVEQLDVIHNRADSENAASA